MDRMTHKTEYGNYAIKCEDCKYKDECEGHDVDCEYYLLRELGRLEDKLENGTLIELPCKVGDKVYYETFTRNGKQNMGIQGHEVLGIRVLVMAKNNYGNMWTEIPLSCFGKDTFLTKAEAEAKLKELREI